MDLFIGNRQKDTTTRRLIELSASGKGIIVAPAESGISNIKAKAAEMGLTIPEPVTWYKFMNLGYNRIGAYLIDSLGEILMNLNVEVAAIGIDIECTTDRLFANSIHYGNDLAAWIRKTAKSLNKLSVFDKFVLNNGYRYKTKEELQAGYDRYWKASHDILITMEEFLAEAEKEPSDAASAVYKVLVSLIEEKKLHPGEVFDYAHYHWCLDSPEAIIAYQTGRDEWSVNNCGTEITEEAARVKICEEWGFEAGRICIIGNPYYDATDYQFIRFNCGHMDWLWRNGSLLQIYY